MDAGPVSRRPVPPGPGGAAHQLVITATQDLRDLAVSCTRLRRRPGSEHLEMLALGEVIARHDRHPSQVHHTVMAGATWEQTAATTGGDPRRRYRRDLPAPRARRPGLPGPPAPGRAPDQARRPGQSRPGDPAPPPVYGRATAGSSLWPSLPADRRRLALRRRPADLADVGPDRQRPQHDAPSRRADQHRPPDRQTARPPTPQEAGGLYQQPDEGERANVQKLSDSGQPPKADRWPEGPAGADAHPAA